MRIAPSWMTTDTKPPMGPRHFVTQGWRRRIKTDAANGDWGDNRTVWYLGDISLSITDVSLSSNNQSDDAAPANLLLPPSTFLHEVADEPHAAEGVARTQLSVPDAALEDLSIRLARVRWPDQETVGDGSQGLPLARARWLVEHWSTRYDWRRFEALLNGLGHYVTNVGGIDVHFLHVQSPHPDATPVILTHGWPGSFVEFIRAIGPLTDPTTFGGEASDAFHVVAPCMPGFGFSESPRDPEWTVDRTAAVWADLMRRLGYHRYIAQGGDWGGAVTHALGALAPDGLAGIHLNFPPWLFAPPVGDDPSADELTSLEQIRTFHRDGEGYHREQTTRPQTIGYGLTDSPVGLATWIFEKFDEWTDSGRRPEDVIPVDMMLDNISLYWLSHSTATSIRHYWNNRNLTVDPVRIPVGVSAFPGEFIHIPHEWARRGYSRLIYFNDVARGGHFAAFEQPELFAAELRSFIRRLADE